MPIVPMFHVNAWGYPYACTMTGAKQVYMSVFTDPKTIARIIAEEGVTVCAGVPTIFLGLLDEMDRAKAAGTPHRLPSLKCLVIGGERHAAVTDRMVRRTTCHLREAGVGHDRDHAARHGEHRARRRLP